jgi:DNA end-binding protein Ku
MAHSVWKGSLSFGLLTIPIRLFTAARSERMDLHQIHQECKTRLRQPLFCPTCERNVERSEVIRGYEHDDSQYVLVEDEELKKITPRSGRIMEIELWPS